jgi:hypothetical protein
MFGTKTAVPDCCEKAMHDVNGKRYSAEKVPRRSANDLTTTSSQSQNLTDTGRATNAGEGLDQVGVARAIGSERFLPDVPPQRGRA